jgi:5-formyltetrahydrofolate cyclo-ligase
MSGNSKRIQGLAMKKNLRKTILSKRKEMFAEKYQQKSEIICQKLLNFPQIQDAETIHVYYPINQEVDIRPFIEYLWNEGKKVVMPRADFATKEMENYFVISFGQLEETKYAYMNLV